jgi:hypothetical protein
MAVITLDRDALDHARAIVDRERASPQQEARFEWTARLILATFLLLVIWIVTAINAPFYQRAFLFLAAATCMAAITLFAINARFVSRLWRSFWTAKQHGLHWRNARRTAIERASLAALAVIHVLGYPLLLVGVSGLEEEMRRGNPVEFLAALSVVSFAVGSLLLLPMEVVRWRVNAMRALRDALDSTEPTGDGNVKVQARAYDRITDLQFQHSVIDSHRSLANDAGFDADDLALRISSSFQEAVAHLPGTQSDRVYDLVAELDNRFDVASAAPGSDMLISVPGTAFQIRVRWHPERNEIEVVALETVPAQGRPSHG